MDSAAQMERGFGVLSSLGSPRSIEEGVMSGIRIFFAELRTPVALHLGRVPASAPSDRVYAAIELSADQDSAAASDRVLAHALAAVSRPGDALILLHHAEITNVGISGGVIEQRTIPRGTRSHVARIGAFQDADRLADAFNAVPDWNETLFAAAGPRATIEAFLEQRFLFGYECNLVNEELLLPEVTAIASRGWDGGEWRFLSAALGVESMRSALTEAAARVGVPLAG
jgi:hypothetical protein